MEESKKIGLYQKMHRVMCETEGIEKNLTVGFGGSAYKAVGEASVLNAVKPLLKKHGLVLMPVGIDHEERIDSFLTAKGETSRVMTQIKAKYKIVDIDTGEYEILETIGNGVDTQDKASGKAMTYGYKVLLQKTFMLFSGEDTDNEHSDEITDKQTFVKQPTQTKETKSAKPMKTQLRDLCAKAVADGKTEALLKALEGKKVEDMSSTEVEKYFKKVKAI